MSDSVAITAIIAVAIVVIACLAFCCFGPYRVAIFGIICSCCGCCRGGPEGGLKPVEPNMAGGIAVAIEKGDGMLERAKNALSGADAGIKFDIKIKQ